MDIRKVHATGEETGGRQDHDATDMEVV